MKLISNQSITFLQINATSSQCKKRCVVVSSPLIDEVAFEDLEETNDGLKVQGRGNQWWLLFS